MPEIEFVDYKKEKKKQDDVKQLIIAIKSLETRYKVVLVILYMMCALLAVMIWTIASMAGVF